MDFKVELERIHTCDGKEISRKKRTITIKADIEEDVIPEALDRAFGSQYRVFGDTGMDDGEYDVRILSIDGKTIDSTPRPRVKLSNQGD